MTALAFIDSAGVRELQMSELQQTASKGFPPPNLRRDSILRKHRLWPNWPLVQESHKCHQYRTQVGAG